jgi:hypothetical protein
MGATAVVALLLAGASAAKSVRQYVEPRTIARAQLGYRGRYGQHRARSLSRRTLPPARYATERDPPSTAERKF